MHIGAAIFDFDGVILDSCREGLRRIQILCAVHQIPFTREVRTRLLEHWGMPGVELLMAGLPIQSRTFAESVYKEWERIDREQRVPLVPGARDTLIWLRQNNIKICLLTSRRRENTNDMLDQHDLAKEFSVIATRDDSHYSKPDPRAFRFTLEALEEKYGIARNACIFVGDTVADVEGGCAANIETLVVQTGPYLLKQVEQLPIPLSNVLQSIDNVPFWIEECTSNNIVRLYM